MARRKPAANKKAARSKKGGAYECPKCLGNTIAPDPLNLHKCARCRSEYLDGKAPPARVTRYRKS